jgi:hypothetical protein
MAKPEESYQLIVVESYKPTDTSGLHGAVHIRPVAGQGFANNMHVQCPKTMKVNYPVGTKFKIKAKLTDREGLGEFLYTSWRWPFEVIN